MKLNSELIKEVYSKGYRVIGGQVYNKNGRQMVLATSQSGYYTFSYRFHGKQTYKVKAHRLLSYQMFGDAMFEEGKCIIFKDRNKLNINPDNLMIGTRADMMMNLPEHERKMYANIAANQNTKYRNVKEIQDFHNQYHSYKMTMEKFDIPNKASLYYILKKRIA